MNKTIRTVFDLLLTEYGPLHWWPAETPFEVCVGAILTQNTRWGNVEKAIANLKRDGVLSVEALRDMPRERLAALIRPSGFYNLKSARLASFLDWLAARYGGSLGRMFAGDWRLLREELLAVKGIGRETADAMLLYAGGKPSFVVDASTVRLLSRIGMIGEDVRYEGVRALFMDNLPAEPDLFNEYHALIVQHGKRHCRAKPRCAGCPLRQLCRHGHALDPVAPLLLGPVE